MTTKTLPACPVTIFPNGGVNLDSEDACDLMQFWAWGGCFRINPTPCRACHLPGSSQRLRQRHGDTARVCGEQGNSHDLPRPW